MSAGAVRDRKRRLRSESRAIRVTAPREAAAAARVRLGELDVWESARSVALYAARRDEPSLDAFAERLVGAGVGVAWPRIESDRIVLRRAAVADLSPGYQGIREPSAEAPSVSPEQIDVFVVPGLLFDRHGFRLGHGRGHYDRLLSGARSDSLSIGFSFAERVVDSLPVDDWDVAMHLVVTQSELIAGTSGQRH
jgi:5-formyltetrahydrofolate cyclo-ligase